jgi:hypothetical protein
MAWLLNSVVKDSREVESQQSKVKGRDQSRPFSFGYGSYGRGERMTPNEFWSRSDEGRSQRFYVVLCEFTSAFLDYAKGSI